MAKKSKKKGKKHPKKIHTYKTIKALLEEHTKKKLPKGTKAHVDVNGNAVYFDAPTNKAQREAHGYGETVELFQCSAGELVEHLLKEKRFKVST